MLQVAREGYGFILTSAAVAVVGAAAGWWVLGGLALLATCFCVGFFRDPERLTPPGDHLVTAPADGKVVSVLEGVREDRFLMRECRRVSIFMSPLDVHVNRIPISGTVVDVAHRRGHFHAAFLDKSSELNEQNAVVLEDVRGERVLCVQIAGKLVRRIVCRLRPGDQVRRGDRYGMIMFGSRLDLYLPPSLELSVKAGDYVVGARSVIGAYP